MECNSLHGAHTSTFPSAAQRSTAHTHCLGAGFYAKAMLFTLCVSDPSFKHELGPIAAHVLGVTPWFVLMHLLPQPLVWDVFRATGRSGWRQQASSHSSAPLSLQKSMLPNSARRRRTPFDL